jgi:16S rRNA (guanine966-N2)-methyltransferase
MSRGPRIIAGEFRSRRLRAPKEDDLTTRPYTDRVKESVFNLLRGWFEGARVFDVFAGIGTMGLEAVSRGAERVVMVEQNRRVHELLQKNIAALGCGDRAEAVVGDALSPAIWGHAPKPVDIVFIDPPYAWMENPSQRERVLEQAARCRDIMAEQGFLVLRSPIMPAADGASPSGEWLLIGFDGPEVHRYASDMWVLLYSPARTAQPPETSDGSALRAATLGSHADTLDSDAENAD